MDTLSKMDTFIAVVETGSFAGAARKIGMTRSAVSRQIVALERSLRTTLIVRTTRQSHLTQVGEAYYKRCCDILQLAEQAHAEASGKAMEVSGALRIVAPILLHHVLVPTIAEFLLTHPEVTIDAGFSDTSTNLVDEGIDLAIRIGPSDDSTLTATKIAPIRYVVCASPQYLQVHGTPNTPSELAQHRWIAFSPLPAATTWTFQRARRSYSVRVNRVFATNASIALRDALLENVGITVIPQFYVDDLLNGGQLVRLLPDYSLPDSGIYGMYPHQQALPARTRSFLDALKSSITSHGIFSHTQSD